MESNQNFSEQLELIIPIGMPGCGKTNYYVEHYYWQSNTFRVSPDNIRELMFGDASIQRDSSLVFNGATQKLLWVLEHKYNAYFDATNAKKEWRRPILESGFIHHALIRAIVFKPNLFTAIKRDMKRNRRVGWWVILKYYFTIEMPSFDEGFDEIVYVDENGQLIKCDRPHK